MKKYFIIAMLLFTTSTSWGSEIEWGLLGGLNYNKAKIDAEGEKLTLSSTIGFQIGTRAYQNIDHIKLRYGFEIKQINLNDDFTFYDDFLDEFYSSKIDISNLYISIPISILHSLNDKFSLLGGVGLNILLADKHKVDNAEMNIKYKNLFLTLEIGTLINLAENILLEASYNMSLMPIYNEQYEKVNTSGLVFNVVYLL